MKLNENATVPLSLVIPRLQLQDQRLPECGVEQHRAARKRPCGLIRLWGHWGCREGGMSDSQPARRRMQGAPGRRCRRGFLWVRARVAAWLVLHFGNVPTLAQSPMPQQPVCPREVLQNKVVEGSVQSNDREGEETLRVFRKSRSSRTCWHRSHWYGFSPLWTRLCLSRW